MQHARELWEADPSLLGFPGAHLLWHRLKAPDVDQEWANSAEMRLHVWQVLCKTLTGPVTIFSHSWGLANRNAVLTPASGSGQSFLCRASSWAATTAVGGSRWLGSLTFRGFCRSASLAKRLNSCASCCPADAD